MTTRPITPENLPEISDFINERVNYVTALRNSTSTDSDYWRWQGGSEARRQLAETLGWTVPHESGERTTIR